MKFSFKIPLVLSFCLFLIWLLFLSTQSGYYLTDNNADYFLGSYLHSYRSLVHHGELAQINFHQFLGNTHHGQGQTAVLYPPLYFCFFVAEFLLGNVYLGIDLLFLLHMLLAGLGMYFFLTHKKTGEKTAFLASLSFVTTPYIFGVSRSWIVVMYLAAYTPWIFLFFDRWLTQSKKSDYFLMIGLKVLLTLQGYIQWIVMYGLVELIYFGLDKLNRKTLKKQKQTIQKYLTSWIVVLGVTAPLILPLWKASQRSGLRSQALPIEEAMKHAVNPILWFKAQFGFFFDGIIFDGSTYIYSIGLALLFGFVLVGKRLVNQSTETKKFFILTLLTLLYASPLYVVIVWLPGLNLFRWPFKYLILFSFFLITTVSLGLKKQSKLLQLILIVSLSANLGILWFNRDVEFLFSRRQLDPKKLEAPWLQLIDPQKGRILSFNIEQDKEPKNFALLAGYNMASVFEVNHFGGYDAIQSNFVWEITRGTPGYGSPPIEYSQDVVDYMRSWSVRYWIGNDFVAADELIQTFGLQEIYKDNQVILLEDQQALPMIYDAETKEAVSFTQNINSLTLTTKPNQTIVFNLVHWPEYKVLVDGQRLNLGDLANRPTFQIDQEMEVEVRYHDPFFTRGLLIALMSGIGIVWLEFFSGSGHKKK